MHWTSIRRRLVRHRRLVASALIGVAVLATLSLIHPIEPATRLVVTSVAELPAGVRLTDEDLALVASTWMGPAYTDIDDAIGQVTTTPLLAGEIVSESRTVAAQDRPGGEVIVPIKLADSDIATLLNAGDRVDVVGAGRVVAANGRVVTVATRRGTSGGFGSPAGAAGVPIVMLALDRTSALRVAGAHDLSIVLH